VNANDPDLENPCVTCGACCALFRVSFHWSEADAGTGGRTPAELSVRVTPHRVAMRGTEKVPIRCIALEGEIGKRVGCTI
jgi:Fe-S-cluster containining protein